MLTTFTGYRGYAMFLEIGNVKFCVISKNRVQAQALYSQIVPHAPPFNPAACTKAIMIQSTILPKSNERKQTESTGNHPETTVGQ
jgi:hypothetical protein